MFGFDTDRAHKVEYKKGADNRTDFLSRQSKPPHELPLDKQTRTEATDLNNLLYMMHTTPIIDHISPCKLAEDTASDTTYYN